MSENTKDKGQVTSADVMNETIKAGARAWGAYLALNKATIPFQVKVGKALIEIKKRANGNTKVMGEIREKYFKRPDGSTIRNDEASNMIWVAKFEDYVSYLFERSDSVKMIRRLYNQDLEQATRENGKVPGLPDGIVSKATKDKLEAIVNPPAEPTTTETAEPDVVSNDEIDLKPESIIARLAFVNEQFSKKAEDFNDVQFQKFMEEYRALKSLVETEQAIRAEEREQAKEAKAK